MPKCLSCSRKLGLIGHTSTNEKHIPSRSKDQTKQKKHSRRTMRRCMLAYWYRFDFCFCLEQCFCSSICTPPYSSPIIFRAHKNTGRSFTQGFQNTTRVVLSCCRRRKIRLKDASSVTDLEQVFSNFRVVSTLGETSKTLNLRFR